MCANRPPLTSDMAVDPAPGAATPAGSPDGAGARMVREACPTIAGDEETYGDGAPGAPSRQEGPRGPKKRDRAAADPGMVTGGVPDRGLEAGGSGLAAVIPPKKRRRSGGPARAAREAAFLASKAHAATGNP